MVARKTRLTWLNDAGSAKRFRIFLGILLVCAAGAGATAYFTSRQKPPDYKKLSTEQLRSLTATHPMPQAYLALFQRAYDAGDREAALKIARDMLHRYPSDPRAHNLLGIAYAASEDVDGARKAFHNAISLNSRYVEPYVNLGRLSLLMGDNATAVNEFDLATVTDPKSASAWTGLGEAHAKLYDAAEATDAFQRAIRLAPNRSQAYAHLGVFLAEMGDGDKARPYLKRAQDLGEKSAPLFVGLAMAYADQPRSKDELTQAVEFANIAHDMGDNDGLVYYAQGLALQRLERYDQAIESFRKDIGVSANANGAWIGISQCYRALGKTKLADDAAKTGERILSQRQHISNLKYEIRNSPNRLDVREQYAEALLANKQYLVAAEQYRYVATHNPEKRSLWLKAAHAFDLGGEKRLANYVRPFAYEKPSVPPASETHRSSNAEIPK